jgi:hypothetical protein
MTHRDTHACGRSQKTFVSFSTVILGSQAGQYAEAIRMVTPIGHLEGCEPRSSLIVSAYRSLIAIASASKP